MSKSIWSDYRGFRLRSWTGGSYTIHASVTFERIGTENVQFGPFPSRVKAEEFIVNFYRYHDGGAVLKIRCEIPAKA